MEVACENLSWLKTEVKLCFVHSELIYVRGVADIIQLAIMRLSYRGSKSVLIRWSIRAERRYANYEINYGF